MTSFNERELAFEAKFAHEEEFRFLTEARRDKLFAHWAASTAGLADGQEEALVSAILAIPNGPAHDSAMLTYASRRLQSFGINLPDADVRAALTRCAAEALRQLNEHPPEHSDIV